MLEVHGDPQLVAVGRQGPSFSPALSGSADKPQSKLWFNDGSWWAAVYVAEASAIAIVDMGDGSSWDTTDTLLDERASAHADVLWDGETLHVATVGPDTGSVTDAIRYQRLAYDARTRRYDRIEGFPIMVNGHGSESAVLTRDSLGIVWLAYTHAGEVLVSHSDVGGTHWTAPRPLPVPAAQNLTQDDIAASVAFVDRRFGPSIAIAFGNQNLGAYTFATHADGDADDEWRVETPLSGPELADDHLNFKSAVIDGESWVVGIVKTSLNDPAEPLLMLLVRHPDGRWVTNPFGRVQDQHTRAEVLIDDEHRQVLVFASAPCCSGGVIYTKTTSLDVPQYAVGLGDEFIALKTDSTLNNPTTTKQPVNSSTGVVVLASDNNTQTYAFNRGSLGDDDIGLDTLITAGPDIVTSDVAARFEFVATSTAARFECSLDRAPFAECGPELTLPALSTGSHELLVRAVDRAHPDVIDSTPARYAWRQVAVSLYDDFETGLGSWDVQLTGAGVADTIVDAAATGHRARFASDGSAGSTASASRDLAGTSELIVDAAVEVTTPAEPGAHVRLLTMLAADDQQVLYVYRQSGEADDGRIWIRAGGTRFRTDVVLPVGERVDLSLGVSIESGGLATIGLSVDGRPAVGPLTANLGVPSVQRLQIGYATPGQRYALLIDDVRVLT